MSLDSGGCSRVCQEDEGRERKAYPLTEQNSSTLPTNNSPSWPALFATSPRKSSKTQPMENLSTPDRQACFSCPQHYRPHPAKGRHFRVRTGTRFLIKPSPLSDVSPPLIRCIVPPPRRTPIPTPLWE